MTNREKLKRAIISAIHQLPYEEVKAIEKRRVICLNCNGDGFTAEHDPNDPHENGCSNCPIQVQCDHCHANGYIEKPYRKITIGRVMEALKMIEGTKDFTQEHTLIVLEFYGKWKRVKESGVECTDDDQTDEMIDKLLKIFN